MAYQITPEQLAELQRTNPQAATQLMRQLGMPTPADDINANDAGIRAGMDWLGADGMPTRVSQAPAANTSMKAPPKQGKQDRGVQSNAAPLPPRRPSSLDNINPSSPPSSQSADPMDYGSDTARTNARGGVKSQPSANAPAGTPVDAPLPPSRPSGLGINSAVAAPTAAGGPAPRPLTADVAAAEPRIAAEIFGNAPMSPQVQASAAAQGAGTFPYEGPPAPAGVMATQGGELPASPEANQAAAAQGVVPGNAMSSWKDILSSILGPDPELIQALAAEGVDFNAMSPQDRMRAGTMGAQKFLAQNARKPAPRTSRQQSQR